MNAQGAQQRMPDGQRNGYVVNIRPAVSVYATYRRLSYKPWYAIAEFVDNSTQNYYDHRDELCESLSAGGPPQPMRVEVNYDLADNVLTVSDNANGMDLEELTRAVVLDSPPPNRAGRSEFGMGLKTAACWFGQTWTIRTCRLGSARELSVRVHVPDLVEQGLEEQVVSETTVPAILHYTIVKIEGLYNPIRGRTPHRIREQLRSMYREDLRSGEIEILWNGERLSFDDPPIFTEAVNGETREWKKTVAFSVPWRSNEKPLTARGWVGIRMPGSQKDAGFVLLRRGRVVIGGPGDGYKPVEVFGQGNTYRSQRLVGELHMDDWPVSQAKDTFDWSGGLEDAFIDQLKSVCDDVAERAESYRERQRPVERVEMEQISERTQRVFADARLGQAVVQDIRSPQLHEGSTDVGAPEADVRSVSTGPIVYRLDMGIEVWQFRLFWQSEIREAPWMQVRYPGEGQIDVYLNMAHPFFVPYLGSEGVLEMLQKLVMALALAERMARASADDGLVSPTDFRMYMNRVLRRVSEIEVAPGGA